MKLDHIGIAQHTPAGLTKLFADLGLAAFSDAETIDRQHVTAQFAQLGSVAIELICPTSPESPVAKFLENKGPGMHHMAFLVDDIAAERTRLESLGYKALSEAPTLGARGKLVQFFHPKETAGVLLELCQYAPK